MRLKIHIHKRNTSISVLFIQRRLAPREGFRCIDNAAESAALFRASTQQQMRQAHVQEALLGDKGTVPGALDSIQLHHAANLPQPFLFVAVLTTTSTLARRWVGPWTHGSTWL